MLGDFQNRGQNVAIVIDINVDVRSIKMPYINEEERLELDEAINYMIEAIRNSKCSLFNHNDFSNYLGRINYCFSRVIMGVMKTVSYKNIAMSTGVLENIKQELYRRVASSYEDQKILANGDIPEYKKLR
jgi:hypothetical protein